MLLLVLQERSLGKKEIVILKSVTDVLHKMVDITEDIDFMPIDSEGIHYITATGQ